MSVKRVKKTEQDVAKVMKTMEETFERFEAVDQNVRENKNAVHAKIDKVEELTNQAKEMGDQLKQASKADTVSDASKQVLTRRRADVKNISRQIRAKRRA